MNIYTLSKPSLPNLLGIGVPLCKCVEETVTITLTSQAIITNITLIIFDIQNHLSTNPGP